MKIKILIASLLLASLLSACVSNNIAWKTNENVKQVKIGMSKSEVIKILGDKYMIIASSRDPDSNPVEVLGYKSDIAEEYHLTFIGDKLSEWSRKHIQRHVVKPIP